MEIKEVCAFRKHMASVPGGDIDLEPVEHTAINTSGRKITYSARDADGKIKEAWYRASYESCRNRNGRLYGVYGFSGDHKCYTYISNDDSDQ